MEKEQKTNSYSELIEHDKSFIRVRSIWEYRLYSGLFGFCVGDALGVPVKFSTRGQRKEDPVQEMRAYGTHYQPVGTWSDNTTLMLCLIGAINQGYNIKKVANNFVSYYKNGAFTLYGKVFDTGISTESAIIKICNGKNPVECGGESDMDNGNGSLMMSLPVAFYGFQMKEFKLISLIKAISSLTYRHKHSVFACILYVRFAIELLTGNQKEEALDKAIDYVKKNCPKTYSEEWHHFENILSKKILCLPEDAIKSTEYVVDTLEAALWTFFHGGTYREIVLKAVNLGGNTNTIAAIAGGIAGIYYCADINRSLPDEWLQCLAKKEELYQLFQKFYDTSSLPGIPNPWTKAYNDMLKECPRNKAEYQVLRRLRRGVSISELIEKEYMSWEELHEFLNYVDRWETEHLCGREELP